MKDLGIFYHAAAGMAQQQRAKFIEGIRPFMPKLELVVNGQISRDEWDLFLAEDAAEHADPTWWHRDTIPYLKWCQTRAAALGRPDLAIKIGASVNKQVGQMHIETTPEPEDTSFSFGYNEVNE